MPFPNRLREGDWKELGCRPELQASPSEVVDGITVHLDPKEVSEQLKVSSCPQKTLTEGDKIGDTENPIGRNVMQLAAKEV